MKCPICQEPTIPDFAPFCSKYCQNIDLIRWTKEDYRIPTNEAPTDQVPDTEDEE